MWKLQWFSFEWIVCKTSRGRIEYQAKSEFTEFEKETGRLLVQWSKCSFASELRMVYGDLSRYVYEQARVKHRRHFAGNPMPSNHDRSPY